eukprot:545126-Rhodomonas_salina.2
MKTPLRRTQVRAIVVNDHFQMIPVLVHEESPITIKRQSEHTRIIAQSCDIRQLNQRVLRSVQMNPTHVQSLDHASFEFGSFSSMGGPMGGPRLTHPSSMGGPRLTHPSPSRVGVHFVRHGQAEEFALAGREVCVAFNERVTHGQRA